MSLNLAYEASGKVFSGSLVPKELESAEGNRVTRGFSPRLRTVHNFMDSF